MNLSDFVRLFSPVELGPLPLRCDGSCYPFTFRTAHCYSRRLDPAIVGALVYLTETRKATEEVPHMHGAAHIGKW
jgi:hypothetical protein